MHISKISSTVQLVTYESLSLWSSLNVVSFQGQPQAPHSSQPHACPWKTRIQRRKSLAETDLRGGIKCPDTTSSCLPCVMSQIRKTTIHRSDVTGPRTTANQNQSGTQFSHQPGHGSLHQPVLPLVSLHPQPTLEKNSSLSKKNKIK